MTDAALRDFATRYTAAWCSHDPAKVASCFAENGSLIINGGIPSVGRPAIAAAAQDFVTTFPDMVVIMELALNSCKMLFIKKAPANFISF